MPVLGLIKRELRRAEPRPGTAALLALAVLDAGTRGPDGPLRLTGLAERLQVDLSVASRQVASLIEMGAVERVVDQRDGRARRLRVTADGRQLLSTAQREVARLVADQLTEWNESDLLTLVTLLARLRADLTIPSDLSGASLS